jgi:hypothetical protein
MLAEVEVLRAGLECKKKDLLLPLLLHDSRPHKSFELQNFKFAR